MNKHNGLCKLGMLAAVLTLGLGSADASASILAKYEFTDNTLSPTYTDASVSATAISFTDWTTNAAYPGDGVSPLAQSDRLEVFADDTNPAAGVGSALFTDALAADNFIEFTITGTDFDVFQIKFDYTVQGSNSYSYGAFLLSDATGSTIQGEQTFSLTTNSSTTVEVSAINPADWEGLSSITFQIYLADSTFNSNGRHIIDNIVVVPEPRSMALLALGLLCLARRRRRNP